MVYYVLAFLMGLIIGVGALVVLALNYNSHEASRDRKERDISQNAQQNLTKTEITTEKNEI